MMTTAINADDAARATRDEKTARAAGFAPAPPIFTLGTPVNSTGVENFTRSRMAWEKLPDTAEACDKLADFVAAERREDITVKAIDLAMRVNGNLIDSATNTEYAMEEEGFLSFARQVTPGGAVYLSRCEPDLRGVNINSWLGASKPERKLVLRSRVNQATSKRGLFATVTPSYKAYDMDAIARAVKASLPPGCRGDLTYDGRTARIDALFHTDIKPSRAVAGEFFKAGVSIQTRDDGSGAARVRAEAYRNLCLNLIVIDVARITQTVRHQGNDIAANFAKAVAKAFKAVEGFADVWNAATVENVLDRYEAKTPEEIFTALCKHRLVHVPGFAGEAMVDRLMAAWNVEPGYCRSNFINAITRAAHAEEWQTFDATGDLEAQAGQLLYARVWQGVGETVADMHAGLN